MKKNKKNVVSPVVLDYLTRSRPFSFISNVDSVTTVVALLESWLTDYEDCRTSSNCLKRRLYQDVFDFVRVLRDSL